MSEQVELTADEISLLLNLAAYEKHGLHVYASPFAKNTDKLERRGLIARVDQAVALAGVLMLTDKGREYLARIEASA